MNPSRPAASVPAAQRSRRRRWPMRLAAVVIGAAVGVGLLEAALWIVAPVKYHEWMLSIPDGHIRGRAEPGQVFKTKDGFDVRINRLGFRGPDYDWEPAPGTLRLAAFGGSSTFCYNARGEENTWTARLQHYLHQRLGIPVEVINLGLPGFDASNSKVNYLFTGRALHPHVILVYHTWNDMKLFRVLKNRPIVFAGVETNKPFWQRIARATQIGRRARNALQAMQLTKSENYYTTLEKEGAEANQPVVPAAYAWDRKNFEDFVRLARSDGVLPVLITQATIVQPVNFDRPEYRREMNMDLVGMTIPIIHQTWLEMNRIIEDVARRNDAVFVDGYRAVPPDFDHLIDAVHLTDRGSDLLGRTIAGGLLKDARFLRVAERVRGRRPPDSLPAG